MHVPSASISASGTVVVDQRRKRFVKVLTSALWASFRNVFRNVWKVFRRQLQFRKQQAIVGRVRENTMDEQGACFSRAKDWKKNCLSETPERQSTQQRTSSLLAIPNRIFAQIALVVSWLCIPPLYRSWRNVYWIT